MPERVAIIGTGQIPHRSRRYDVDEPEMLYEAVSAALEDAGISYRDVEAVIFGSAISSIQEGVEHVGKWVNDFCGGYLKPHMRVHTGGSVGACAGIGGFYYVASGLYDLVLACAGTIRMGASGAAAQKGLALVAEPIYRRWFAGGAVMGLAMTFKEYMNRTGVTEEHAARCAVQQRENGTRNPYAHLREKITVEQVLNSRPLCPPIKLLDMCPTSIGAAAMVIASEEKAKKICKRPAWVKGFASITEPSSYPHRDTLEARPIRASARKAYTQAGITNPRKEADVVELYNASSFQQMIWSEALFLCDRGEGGKLLDSSATDMSGDIPVNPSGGVFCTNNGSDAAMLRQVEAALQVTGKAGERQVEGARTAVAMGWGGSQQFTAVTVLSSEP